MRGKNLENFNTKQREIQSFAFVISACIAALFGLVFLRMLHLETAQTSHTRLQTRINPNIAPVSSLIRLPGIGPSRANAIIAYRQKVKKENPNTLPFRQTNDLQRVKSIGPKTVENIKPFLTLEPN
jgi:competence protein ComEA